MLRPTPHTDEALWIEYLDWCSLQVLGKIAELPPEGMWLLDQESLEGRQPAGADGAALDDRMLPRIRRIAVHVFRTLDLPDFETWKGMSREDLHLSSPSSESLAGTE